MSRVRSSVKIRRPVNVVFDYVTTPGHWPDWHPSSLAVTGATDHPLLPGEQVTEDYESGALSEAGFGGRRRGTALSTSMSVAKRSVKEMAQIINATEAMQVLQDHFGERLDTSRDDGIDQMAEVLKNKFSLSGRDAKEVVKDLEAARSIRWVENTSDQSAGVTGTVRAETPGPLPITAVGNGYWDLVH